jgi:hypothetical protein
MPIRPENKARYPKDWKAISARIRERAGNKCEQCGVENGVYRNTATGETTTDLMQVEAWGTCDDAVVSRIVLTVAHLNHRPEDCSDDNLRAWCQKCHNGYDAKHRAAGIKERARTHRAVGDLFNA